MIQICRLKDTHWKKGISSQLKFYKKFKWKIRNKKNIRIKNYNKKKNYLSFNYNQKIKKGITLEI